MPHHHPLQEEVFIVKRGSILITIEGQEHRVEAGSQITVPPDAMHHWRNAGSDELYMLTEFRPALHFEEIIETIACLSQMGKMDAQGNPNPLQMSATLSAFPGEFYLGTMPVWLQKFLFGPFGRVLRMLGHKACLQFDDLKKPIVS